MKVRAVKRGYFGEVVREPGAEFECSVAAFSDALRKANPPGWMEVVEASAEEMREVEARRAKDGIRKNPPPAPKGSAKDLGVSKSTAVEAPGVETKPPAETGKHPKGGGTGSKDVIGSGK